MKKLNLFSISKNDLWVLNNIKTKTNKIFKFIREKNFFLTLSHNWEEFNIEIISIKLDEKTINFLAEKIIEIIDYSHDVVKKYGLIKKPKENFNFHDEYFKFGALDPWKVLKSDVCLWLNTLLYRDKLDIINICCWIPFKLLTKRHIWWNGNKRTSLSTCINLLRFFNLYLSYSDNSGISEDGTDRWYNLFTKYVHNKEGKPSVELNPEKYDELYLNFYSEITKALYYNVYNIKEDQ